MSLPLADAFQFCPRCGEPIPAPGSNPMRCGRCEFVYHFTPVAGVVGIIAAGDGSIVLLERARDPGRGLFGLPGGFVDPGESTEEALRREVHEEVRLDVQRMHYLVSFPNWYNYRGVTIPVTDIVYCCEVASFDSLQVDPEEITSARFCRPGPEDLERMAFESNRRALEFYLHQPPVR